MNKHEGYFRVLKVTFVWYGNYFLVGSFESIAGFDLCEILFIRVGEARFVVLLSIDSCGYRGDPKAADHRGYAVSSRGRSTL